MAYLSIERLPVDIPSQIPPVEDFLFSCWSSWVKSSSLNVVRAYFNLNRVPDNSPFNAAKWIPRRKRSSSREKREFPNWLDEDQSNSARMTSAGAEDTSITKSIRRYIFGSSPLDPVWIFHCWKRVNNSSATIIDFRQISKLLLDIFSKSFKTRCKVSKPAVFFDASEQFTSETPPIFRKQLRAR